MKKSTYGVGVKKILQLVFPDILDWAKKYFIEAKKLRSVSLDGEILVMKESRVSSFGALQKRLGRLSPSKKILAESPCKFLAYDILEIDEKDLRSLALSERRVFFRKKL